MFLGWEWMREREGWGLFHSRTNIHQYLFSIDKTREDCKYDAILASMLQLHKAIHESRG